MAMLKSFFYLLIMLVFIVIGLIFSFRNQPLINVDLLFFQSESLSIGFWLLMSLLTGVVLGVMLALPKRFFQRVRIYQLSKKIKDNKLPRARVNAGTIKGN